MGNIVNFQPPTAEEMIEHFAAEFVERGIESMSSITLAKSNKMFEGLKRIAPANVDYVFGNFCDLDFEKVSLEQNYFSEGLSLDYLHEFCSCIRIWGVASVQNLSETEFLRGYVALCQLILANVKAVRDTVKSVESDAGIPDTLVFARIMSFP